MSADKLAPALRELLALVRGECPALLDELRDGDARLSMACDDALAADDAARGAMREAFERTERLLSMDKDNNGDYASSYTHEAWMVWQHAWQAASRAAAPQTQQHNHAAGWTVDDCPACAAAPQSVEPDGTLHADGYFTWREGKRPAYVLDRGLPCKFYLHPAPTEADKLDAQRLDWVFSHWPNGIHVECCATGGPTVHGLVPTVTIFYGPQEWKAPSLRAAIDAAMSAQAGGKETGS
jgi:hypothetical protein